MAENLGWKYKSPSDIKVPDDPDQDDDAVEHILFHRLLALAKANFGRQTTVTVLSHVAEIWTIPRKVILIKFI
jgi:hypothetical protein